MLLFTFLQNVGKMDKELRNNYYFHQLEGVDYHGEYNPTFKIRGYKVETKWMDLNEESATVLVKMLIEKYNLKIS
jgi:hypothetical protein